MNSSLLLINNKNFWTPAHQHPTLETAERRFQSLREVKNKNNQFVSSTFQTKPNDSRSAKPHLEIFFYLEKSVSNTAYIPQRLLFLCTKNVITFAHCNMKPLEMAWGTLKHVICHRVPWLTMPSVPITCFYQNHLYGQHTSAPLTLIALMEPYRFL